MFRTIGGTIEDVKVRVTPKGNRYLLDSPRTLRMRECFIGDVLVPGRYYAQGDKHPTIFDTPQGAHAALEFDVTRKELLADARVKIKAQAE
jgi:hypothetical protein